MKGICNLAVVPLRKLPDSTSEIVSQLLFGDRYEVHHIDKGWADITLTNENYRGFISEKQLCLIVDALPDNWMVNTIYPFVEAHGAQGNLLLPAGCHIPAVSPFTIQHETYSITTQVPSYSPEDIGTIAQQYLNVPYLWGGKTAFGIDCSGFCQVVFRQCGIELPRDAYQQAECGTTLSFVEECRMGDLAFFDNDAGRITHVGIMLDNQRIIHASGKVRIDYLDHHGILNAEEKQYSHKLRLLKRLF